MGCSNSSASTEGVFTNCTALTTIELNDGLEYIGCSAFVKCSNLRDIIFPDSVTFVGDFAFSNTGWVNELSNGEVYIGKVFYKYKGEMPEDTTITIKDGTVGIASYSFGNRTSSGECQGYSQLKKVIIPDTVTCIGNSAFYNCSNLTDLVLPKNLTVMGKEAFYGCNNINEVVIPKGLGLLPSRTFTNCGDVKITFEEGLNWLSLHLMH